MADGQQPISIKFFVLLYGTYYELDDVSPARISYGLPDGKPETRLADIGSMSLTLNNSSGIYTPGVTSGFVEGAQVVATTHYVDNLDILTGPFVFTGYIDKIQLENTGDEKRVKITVVDWFDSASKFPVVNPPLLTDIDFRDSLDELLDLMPITPPSPDKDPGNVIFPTVFDTVKGSTKTYDEMAKLVNSELGYIYIRHIKYWLVYENSTRRNPTRTVTQFTSGGNTVDAVFDNTFSAIDVTYGENTINHFTCRAYPKRTDTETKKLFELEREEWLAAGETKVFRIFFSDETGKRSINAIPPSDFIPTSGTPGETCTVSLIHFDTQDGLTYHDEMGRLWTCTEGGTWITNPNKYGLGSAYLDGANAYMTSPYSPDFNFGAGDFTVEWYEYVLDPATSGATIITEKMTIGSDNGTTKLINLSSDGVNMDIAANKSLGSLTYTTWVHYAVSRNGSNFYAFADGVLTDSWTSAVAFGADTVFLSPTIGANIVSCIDDVRITKGHCYYTTPFAPPTRALGATPGTYLSFWTGQNSTGTDIKDALTTDNDYGTEGATYRITNSGSVGGWLNITAYGYGIYSDSAREDTQIDQASIDAYGYQNEDLQQAYQQDTAIGKLEGQKIIVLESQPRMVVNSITYWANKTEFLKDAFLNLDVGDVINVSSDVHNIADRLHYINGVDLNLRGGLVEVTYILTDAYSVGEGGGTAAIQSCALEFRGAGEMDGVNFGYLPLVSGGAVVSRAFSAWVYYKGGEESQTILSASPPLAYGGFSIQIANAFLTFSSYRYDISSQGYWQCDEGSTFPVDEWVHIFVDYSTTNILNNPGFYINGVEQNPTEVITPTGSLTSEIGFPLCIGRTPDFISFNGIIKDVRIYDVDKSTYNFNDGSVPLGLHYAGPNEMGGWMSGVVFQAPNVTAATYAVKLDETLLSADKIIVLDGLNFGVGTPAGDGPILRSTSYPPPPA